jgi:hypothetical protein
MKLKPIEAFGTVGRSVLVTRNIIVLLHSVKAAAKISGAPE